MPYQVPPLHGEVATGEAVYMSIQIQEARRGSEGEE